MRTTTTGTKHPAVCDSCLTAAYDEGAKDGQTQRTVCAEFGADIPDHLCEAIEEPGTTCACACHRQRAS